MFNLVRSLLFLMPAEKAHYFTMNWLKFLINLPIIKQYFLAKLNNRTYKKPTQIAGLNFHNPIGLAAGFDKNARYYNELHLLGFGFVEIGTVTPKPQEGNPKPRLFRLKKDEALINRMGFNNEGVDAVVERLKKGKIPGLIIGGNIGKNKVTPNAEALNDYVICFEKLHDYVDYFVVNVSSPNTPGLRELQEKTFLTRLLNELKEINVRKGVNRPIFFKIDPNLTWEKVDEMVEIVEETGIAGIITNNTSVDRNGLKTPTNELESIGAGGLSGAPLKERSRAVLQRVLDQKKSDFVVISSGGVSEPSEPKHRFDQGANLVQIWTGFIYKGPKLIKQALQNI